MLYQHDASEENDYKVICTLTHDYCYIAVIQNLFVHYSFIGEKMMLYADQK